MHTGYQVSKLESKAINRISEMSYQINMIWIQVERKICKYLDFWTRITDQLSSCNATPTHCIHGYKWTLVYSVSFCSGPCEALIPSFFFNPKSGRCERFNYGGCQGNKNRFRTEQECNDRCNPDSMQTIPSYFAITSLHIIA